MRLGYDILRTGFAISAVLGVTVVPIALSRAPVQPAVEAVSDNPASGSGLSRLPHLVARAEAADMENAGGLTVGPKSAPRMHGGSVLTDFLSQ
ncbi:MAG: hypothetical protein KF849_16435 [Rhizobiaceae bacterium]|nr:hypothetical protein [Rhizobiaceae bacterium]